METLLGNLEKNPEITLAIKFCKETQFRFSNQKYFTKSKGALWEEHDSVQKISTEFASMSRRFLKETGRQLLDLYGKSKDTVSWLLLLSELRKSLDSDRYLDECISVLQNLDYFCDNAHFYLGVNRAGLIGTQDHKVINPKGQIVRSDQAITKMSAIHTEKSDTVLFDFPSKFVMCLTQALFGCPKTKCGDRVILQIAGRERESVIDWYIKNVAGDYAHKVKSVGDIAKLGCRIAFLELPDDSHAADILRDIRKMKQSCLVVISTSDITALNVDSFWIPNGLKSALGVPVKQWIIDGCKKYSIFEFVSSESPDQVSELLHKFLADQGIVPTNVRSKTKSNRMKLSELADVLQNRARHLGMISLKVRCKRLKELLAQQHFRFVRPQGTLYFTFRIDFEK